MRMLCQQYPFLVTGADKVLYGKDVSREDLEESAKEGKGMLLTGFEEIHGHYMAVANKANR